MAEVLHAEDLLDRVLVGILGPLHPEIVDAIVGVCADALATTVGPEIFAALEADPHRVVLVAPWVLDLARGLLVLHRRGPRELPSSDLLDLLARRRLDEQDRMRFAETVDLAATLTLDRVLVHVLGPGACARDPRENAAAAPWLAALTYGHRVHIALELLRLLPAG
ncbi:MAG: hypothetical protein M0Z46_18945 [Actinomycetota bacterium]|jgi:hypothetical protein|nr:hypothetical protein [Actinomycetota bacterium]